MDVAVKTKDFGVSRAIEFFNKDDIYFGIGKSSEWKASDYDETETIPSDPEKQPPLTRETTNLEEVIGYRKVDYMYLVVPHDGSTVPDGTVIIDFDTSVQWRAVSPDMAVEEGARYVYIETTIQPSDFPEGEYRQVGVFSGLTKKDSVPVGRIVLSPDEVESQGTLEIIDNRVASPLNEYSKETLKFVIKF